MPSWKEPAVITQFGSKGHAPSLAYAGVNTLVWIIYVALLLLATEIGHSASGSSPAPVGRAV